MLDKPFIKLFHTPNSGYVYDVGMNDILRIPENMYQHLMSVLKGQIELDRPNDKELLDSLVVGKPRQDDHAYHQQNTAVIEDKPVPVGIDDVKKHQSRGKYYDLESEKKSIGHLPGPRQNLNKARYLHRKHAYDLPRINKLSPALRLILKCQKGKNSIRKQEKRYDIF